MSANDQLTNITSFQQEKRVFPPPKDFARSAHIKSLAHYRKLYNESIKAPERFDVAGVVWDALERARIEPGVAVAPDVDPMDMM